MCTILLGVRCYNMMHSNCTSLTHWVTHICVSILTIIGSHNGLSPERRQAIIWTNFGILLIGTLETNFSEIISKIHTFSFKKMHLKTLSAKWRPFCHGFNVLTHCGLVMPYGDRDQGKWCPVPVTNIDFSFSEVLWHSHDRVFLANDQYFMALSPKCLLS